MYMCVSVYFVALSQCFSLSSSSSPRSGTQTPHRPSEMQ